MLNRISPRIDFFTWNFKLSLFQFFVFCRTNSCELILPIRFSHAVGSQKLSIGLSTKLQMFPLINRLFPCLEHGYAAVFWTKPLSKTTLVFGKQAFKIFIYFVEQYFGNIFKNRCNICYFQCCWKNGCNKHIIETLKIKFTKFPLLFSQKYLFLGFHFKLYFFENFLKLCM